jgi:hypothetical protein
MRPIDRLRQLATESTHVRVADVPKFRALVAEVAEAAGADARPDDQRQIWELLVRMDDAENFQRVPRRRAPMRPFREDLPARVRDALLSNMFDETEENDDDIY